jgi:hypothetical protein
LGSAKKLLKELLPGSGLDNLLEHVGLVNRQVGQDFPVQLDACSIKRVHQRGIGSAVLPGGGVDAGNPQPAKVALFVPAIPVLVGFGAGNCLACPARAGAVGVLHTLGAFFDFRVPFMSAVAAFDSHVSSFKVGWLLLGAEPLPPQTPTYVFGVTGVEREFLGVITLP